jgi:hypothetical protein
MSPQAGYYDMARLFACMQTHGEGSIWLSGRRGARGALSHVLRLKLQGAMGIIWKRVPESKKLSLSLRDNSAVGEECGDHRLI